MSADIATLFQTMKISGTDATGDYDSLISHVQAEPRLISPVVAKLAEQASLTGKNDAPAVEKALKSFEILMASSAGVIAEPFVCNQFQTILNAASHRLPNVRTAAEAAVNAFLANISPNAVANVLPFIFKAAEIGGQWQTRSLALKVVAGFSDSAPEQLGVSLPDIVPHVTAQMSDVKKEVKAAAIQAMTNACDVIGNKDIEHMTSKIVRSITNPEDVPEIMHNLAGVTFVQSVTSPCLAMVVPLLLRGLRSTTTATRRQAAVIIDNMSKLVDDPLDAAPFLSTLLPALAFAADAMSDPEARKVAENATKQLTRLSNICDQARAQNKGVKKETILGFVKAKVTSDNTVVMEYVAGICSILTLMKKFDAADWSDAEKYLATAVGPAAAKEAMVAILPECKELIKIETKDDEEDDQAEILCNCQFTLAYGTKILLHNTNMRLKRGHKYGLLGGNDSGKTTLMRSIANGSVEGFPDPTTVRTVFVEADILGELSHLSCFDYILQDPRLAGSSRDDVLAVMATVGFRDDSKAKPNHAVSTLSGGWRMKLALARAMLQRADILLLDEPTNHLDVINVAWVKNYINSLKSVTCIMVSHDAGFLNECCTDIIQIDRLKLHQFRGNLDKFIASNPDARAYFSLKEAKLKFKFPQPGPISGVKSRSKALMKMTNCTFTYPVNQTPTLFDITIQVSMASRVGCVGENGAGKSTMIKLLTGELVPQVGECWKHPNARVAYVAQHAFHHIESHLSKTPNEYIRWRYANGEDKESLVKVSMVPTEEEAKLQKEAFEVLWKDEDGKQHKANKVVVEFTDNRRENKQKELEYEVKFRDGSEHYLPFKILQKRGWEKSCKAIDTRIAQRSGLYTRTLSSANVEAHLADVGLEAEFATHYRMSALSGGQKVKVVLAAAMWNQPHILILDEPTNYLDRESLGALAGAITEYEGGVVIISHNNEFVSTLCPEEWVMDSGRLTTRGEIGWMNRQDDKISDQPVITEMVDALGNVTEVKKEKKTLSKRDEKALIKSLQKKIKAGEELEEDEEEFAIANNLM